MLSFFLTTSYVHQMHIGSKDYNKYFRLLVFRKSLFYFPVCSIKDLGYFSMVIFQTPVFNFPMKMLFSFSSTLIVCLIVNTINPGIHQHAGLRRIQSPIAGGQDCFVSPINCLAPIMFFITAIRGAGLSASVLDLAR